jgi:hypothetical protein
MIGLEYILRRLAGGFEWIQLAQDRVRWRAVVNAVMSLRDSDATELGGYEIYVMFRTVEYCPQITS